MEVIQNPWPWYVSGPLLGMTVPLLLLSSNKNLEFLPFLDTWDVP